jgi:hypothetical protein|mmetsp:Transcript_21936/g.47533  ORF Transcript_21936/g.47533 Transcript_21936/m.47533 type:complete len:84 (-) Transcript_21936:49-300(-)
MTRKGCRKYRTPAGNTPVIVLIVLVITPEREMPVAARREVRRAVRLRPVAVRTVVRRADSENPVNWRSLDRGVSSALDGEVEL